MKKVRFPLHREDFNFLYRLLKYPDVPVGLVRVLVRPSSAVAPRSMVITANLQARETSSMLAIKDFYLSSLENPRATARTAKVSGSQVSG